jgi:DNA-binding CsgD family transcriptional regulator
MLMSLAAFHWALACGPADEVTALALRSLESRELIRTGDGLFTVAAIYPLMIADRAEALESWDAMLAETHVHGSLFAVLTVHLFRGYTLLLHGELEEGDRSVETAVEEIKIWGSYGNDPSNSYHVSYRATAATERGNLDAAQRLLESLPRPADHSDGANYLRRAWIEFHLARGEPEAALAVAEDYEAHVIWTENPATAPWRSLKAQALDALGRTGEALPLAEEELELARRWGAPSTVGRALRVLGTLEREEGIARLEEAVSVLEESPARLERAKALAALGAALRRSRRPTDAREPLRRALELADVCGAEPLAADVRTELNAAGVRPRTSALSGVESLTASERRVADLAAGGQTNSEIAQTLFVTPKTVEVHLTNAYRKLGIRSRKQLAGALA